jgi:hypothetical protein
MAGLLAIVSLISSSQHSFAFSFKERDNTSSNRPLYGADTGAASTEDAFVVMVGIEGPLLRLSSSLHFTNAV